MSKQVYHVLYLGWVEAESLCDKYFVDAVFRNLSGKQYTSQLNELVLQFNSKCLKISQLAAGDTSVNEKRVKFPSVPIRDITYVRQGDGDNADLVAFLMLGYSSQTRALAHAHVYKCKSVEETSSLSTFANSKIQTTENQRRIKKVESDLIKRGSLKPASMKSLYKFSFSTENIPQEKRFSVSPNDHQITDRLNTLNKEFKSILSTQSDEESDSGDSDSDEVFDRVEPISLEKIASCMQKQDSKFKNNFIRKCSLSAAASEATPALKPRKLLSVGDHIRHGSDPTEPVAQQSNIGQSGSDLIDTRPLRLVSSFRSATQDHSVDIESGDKCVIAAATINKSY